MNTTTKLIAFVAALAAVFAAAAGVGAAVGPIDVGSSGGHGSTNEHADESTTAAETPHGLSVEAQGVRLVLGASRVDADAAGAFTFRLVDRDDEAVVEFDILHERPLHLIVLNRDLVDYHHLHPVLGADGIWSVDLPALSAGSYRLFADVQPTGSDNITLGADLLVEGATVSAELPMPGSDYEIDGLAVTLDGTPQVGESELSFTVSQAGEPVATEPYLGALGHLVAIRAADLAFLHVHPHDADSEPVTFTAEFPTTGVYRLFFDFSVDGVVRTAAFTVDVGSATIPAATEEADDHGH